jgi:PatG C-terminal
MALKIALQTQKQTQQENNMEPTTETSTDQPGSAIDAPTSVPSREDNPSAPSLAPQQLAAAPAPCPTCAPVPASQARSYVYALGRIEPRFPSPAVEKEFAQAAGRAETKGKTDREAMQAVLSAPENRYLARQLCWVLTLQGLETYLLTPRDSADFDLLVEAVRPTPRPTDLDAVIGLRGPIAPPEMCNGLMVPIVFFDQIYSFDRDALIKSIPRPQKITAKEFQPAAEELFDRIMQMTDNAGATDENRALNYLAVRYPAIYAKVAEQFAANASLSAVEVRPSPLSNHRNIVDVVIEFRDRNTDFAEKFFVRVDVTEEFPFLVTKMSPYYDR